MKNYNFILFHKAIDNVCKAYSSIDKAETELKGAVYEADYTYENEDVDLCNLRCDIETVKCLLNHIEKELVRLGGPT